MWFVLDEFTDRGTGFFQAILALTGLPKLPVDTDDPYLRKVVAAGGFRNYEKAHRQALAKTFARVVFPRLPVDALSHVVAFAFHTGAY